MIKGKIRKMFYGRMIFFGCFGLLLGFQCLSASYYEGSIHSDTKFFMPGVLFLAFALISFLSIFYYKPNLTVSSEIVFTTKFSTHKIQFSDIVTIEYKKVVEYGKAGPLTDGYTVSILILKNTSDKFVISPDVYENYDEVMRVIKNKMCA